MDEVKVAFRKFDNGDIIAIFPEIAWDNENNLMSYMHIGQHGACSPDLLNELTPATEAEYKDLLWELQEMVEYENIKVINPNE